MFPFLYIFLYNQRYEDKMAKLLGGIVNSKPVIIFQSIKIALFSDTRKIYYFFEYKNACKLQSFYTFPSHYQRYEDKMAKLIGCIVNSKPLPSPNKRKRNAPPNKPPSHVTLDQLLKHLAQLHAECNLTKFFSLQSMQVNTIKSCSMGYLTKISVQP